MTFVRPDQIWFVRSNGGSGSYPIRREGWIVVLKFVLGMVGWGAGAAILTTVGLILGPQWVAWTAPAFFAVGAALSAWYFIDTARRHTDYGTTVNEYIKGKGGST